MRTKYKVLMGSFVTLLVYLYLHRVVYENCIKPSVSSYTVLAEHNNERRWQIEKEGDTRKRYILLYTSFFEEKWWGLRAETLGPDYFQMMHCPVTACVLTSARDLLPSVADYDAVVFHIARIWNQPLPSVRRPGQVYVAAVMESPAHTKHNLGLDANFFNWTMTYRLDSDVLFNYQNVVDLESGEVISPAMRPTWRNGFETYQNNALIETVATKRTMAAQFVSHCDTQSKREELVRKLQEAGVKVDVYGSCGPLSCARGNPECNRMLDTVYWFYLSFENSLCVDYVTEKLYNVLQYNIVPVVYGGADYNRFMPPGSYIDAQDYATVDELADYLRYLMDNPHEYVKYLWWKQFYGLEKVYYYCDLCQRLHDVGARTKVQYYTDIKAWWYDDVCTTEPKILF